MFRLIYLLCWHCARSVLAHLWKCHFCAVVYCSLTDWLGKLAPVWHIIPLLQLKIVCALFIVRVLYWVVQKGSKHAVTSCRGSESRGVSWVIKVTRQNFGRVQRKCRKSYRHPDRPLKKRKKKNWSKCCDAKGFERTHQVLGSCLSMTWAGSTSDLCWVYTVGSLAWFDPSLCFPAARPELITDMDNLWV